MNFICSENPIPVQASTVTVKVPMKRPFQRHETTLPDEEATYCAYPKNTEKLHAFYCF